jgi:hypothetical protein
LSRRDHPEFVAAALVRPRKQRNSILRQGIETGNPAERGMLFLISEAELAVADAYEVSDYKRIMATLKSGRITRVYAKPRG